MSSNQNEVVKVVSEEALNSRMDTLGVLLKLLKMYELDVVVRRTNLVFIKSLNKSLNKSIRDILQYTEMGRNNSADLERNFDLAKSAQSADAEFKPISFCQEFITFSLREIELDLAQQKKPEDLRGENCHLKSIEEQLSLNKSPEVEAVHEKEAVDSVEERLYVLQHSGKQDKNGTDFVFPIAITSNTTCTTCTKASGLKLLSDFETHSTAVYGKNIVNFPPGAKGLFYMADSLPNWADNLTYKLLERPDELEGYDFLVNEGGELQIKEAITKEYFSPYDADGKLCARFKELRENFKVKRESYRPARENLAVHDLYNKFRDAPEMEVRLKNITILKELKADSEFLEKNTSLENIAQLVASFLDRQEKSGGMPLDDFDKQLFALCEEMEPHKNKLSDSEKKIRENINNLAVKNGKAELHEAAANGNIELMKVLLKVSQNVKVNAKDFKGETALHHAVANDHKEIIALLIKAGADVNAKNCNGKTVLQHFAIKDETEMFYHLLGGCNQGGNDAKKANPELSKYGLHSKNIVQLEKSRKGELSLLDAMRVFHTAVSNSGLSAEGKEQAYAAANAELMTKLYGAPAPEQSLLAEMHEQLASKGTKGKKIAASLGMLSGAATIFAGVDLVVTGIAGVLASVTFLGATLGVSSPVALPGLALSGSLIAEGLAVITVGTVIFKKSKEKYNEACKEDTLKQAASGLLTAAAAVPAVKADVAEDSLSLASPCNPDILNPSNIQENARGVEVSDNRKQEEKEEKDEKGRALPASASSLDEAMPAVAESKSDPKKVSEQQKEAVSTHSDSNPSVVKVLDDAAKQYFRDNSGQGSPQKPPKDNPVHAAKNSNTFFALVSNGKGTEGNISSLLPSGTPVMGN